MFIFNFSKEELFAALAPFAGKKRLSITGMFKSCNNVNTALSIAYFLKKNKLGGLKVSACPNSLKVEIYLNEKIKLTKLIKEKILVFV